ncbi:hypothetical protein C8N46_106153 [Kordia periserrulae]|uniref:Uncharacterized protein n=1 Tax=Kordia periserrulae TaxID=701523 RepID=A0A2T6BWQ9_9FLAO|nr:hypothetical protein [Kordia periserrulae]PTX60508.1 hypothetical protein C8N46_106153 [Kordia periserrulae]
MKQNIKNTLYRFVTMRAPELIGETDKALGFVQFPTSETSEFITPATQAATPEARKTAIETAITGYTPVYASKAALKTANSHFFELATWLTANRSKFTVTELTAKVDDFNQTGAAIPNMVEIWDDLHYNILTSGDSYLRDVLLSYLVAKFFLDNQLKVDATAKDLQKLAQARVVIDKILFSYEVSPTQPRTPKVAEKHFKKEMNALTAKQNVTELEAIAKEIAKAKKIYTTERARAKAAYQKTHDDAVEAAYAAATLTERVVTDPDTGETSVVKEYTNLTLPEYDFSFENELDKSTLTTRISAPALQVLTDIEAANNVTTLQEIEDIIAIDIQSNTDELFDNIDLTSSEVVLPGGVSVPVNSNATIAPFSYSLCPRRKIGSTLYNFLLTINVPTNSYDVVDVNVDVSLQGTFRDFTEFNMESKVALVLCSDGIDLTNPVDVDILIEFSNGEIYETSVGGLTLKCYLGELTPSVTAPASTEAPVVYGIQRLGIADYRKVEQEVCCYVPGEVSHIENIMAREYKSKDVRRTRRQETTDTFSSETERENLTETTSTDRFEMNQEIASMTAQDRSMNASAGIRWGGENWGGDASASFATNTSSEESESQAITHAKELTERALDRVVQKVREERVTKIVEEYSETTSHGFDNRTGDKHVSGVYRWVDKIYENKILNYGKRLMYEFMIPEPAAFHELAIEITDNEDLLVKPVDPRTEAAALQQMKDYTDITKANSKHWAAIYNAEINPMPAETVYVSKSYSESNMTENSGRWAHSGHESVEIPENYYASKYSGFFTAEHGHREDNGPTYMRGAISIGGDDHSMNANQGSAISIDGDFPNENIINSLDFSVASWDMGAYAFNLKVECKLLPEAYEAWQLETFNAIIEAYEARLAAYEEKYAAQKTKNEEKIKINPGFFREVERTVLRKNCIAYLLGHENMGLDLLQNRLTASEVVPKYSSPALDEYAAKVKFFEQAFEWNIMSYYFYPFYWAKKDKWTKLYQVRNDDPLFKAFLQSGMARVILTVRPGFEEAVNWYMATGQIWNGGQVPTPSDEEFVSIVEELRNPEGVVEETWESRVPTSLTVIQAGAIGLNVEGLPCNDECDDWLRFDTDGNPVVDENGNQISDNPIVQSDELIGGTQSGVGSDVVGETTVQ